MLNEVTLIGRLGQDVELRHTGAGKAVCNLNLAVNEQWTTRDGEQKERTTWVRVSVWERQAEECAKQLSKGSMVCVRGKLQQEEFQKDGQQIKTLGVKAERVLFLERGQGSQARPFNGMPANSFGQDSQFDSMERPF